MEKEKVYIVEVAGLYGPGHGEIKLVRRSLETAKAAAENLGIFKDWLSSRVEWRENKAHGHCWFVTFEGLCGIASFVITEFDLED
jgi:hypothetical protein